MAEQKQSGMASGGLAFAAFLAGITPLFAVDVVAWAQFGISSSLYSYTLLIPFISLYLLRDPQCRRAATSSAPWRRFALYSLGAAGVFLALSGFGRCDVGGEINHLRLLGLLGSLWAGLALWWGVTAWWARAFPLMFLVLLIPLSPAWEEAFSLFLQRHSAWVSYHFIRWTGTPILRDGQLLSLPGLELEVAEQCSGIRSTIVLLITSVLGSYLFLRRLPARLAFVAAVIPIGIARNAFRILVLAWLTLNVDPDTLEGPLHRRGGPLFFVLSLAVLLGWMLLLRRVEKSLSFDIGRKNES